MNVKPIGYSVYPNIMFTVEGGNTEEYFDIVTQKNSGNRGKILSIDCYNFYYSTVMLWSAIVYAKQKLWKIPGGV